MFKCEISGVRKKKELKGKFQRKGKGKKIKVFLGENLECGILLGSYSLVGLYVDLQVQITEKKWKFSKYFAGRVLCLTHVGAPCCETWLKFEIAGVKVAIAKKI